MAKIQVRYLMKLPGKDSLPRYFWHPSKKLRDAGFRLRRVPEMWSAFIDADALEVAAIAAAKELNRQVDEWRTTSAPEATADRVAGPVRRTVAALIEDYKASRHYLELAKSTKRGYDQCLAKIKDWAGDVPVRAVTKPRVQRWYEGMLVGAPAYAAAAVRVLRLLMEHGCREGWILINPAKKPSLAGSDPSGVIWPRAAVAAFVAAADELEHHSVGTAVMLNEWIGQRQGDVLRLSRSIYRDGALTFRQGKTGAGVSVPIDQVPALKTRLEQEAARQRGRNVTATALLVCEATGRRWEPDHFRHVVAEIREHAAKKLPVFEIEYLLPGRDQEDPEAFKVKMDELTFMHLRHTAVTRLADAGCTAELISAITGHSLKAVESILSRYLIRTRRQAGRALQMRRDAEATEVAAESEAATKRAPEAAG